MCVQNFNDSRNLAIRITYRILLRSSSFWEPRHPLLKVVIKWVQSINRRNLCSYLSISFSFKLKESRLNKECCNTFNGLSYRTLMVVNLDISRGAKERSQGVIKNLTFKGEIKT